jgi:hypothetical protein
MLEDCNLITACVGRWDSFLRVLPTWQRSFLPERMFVATATWDQIPKEVQGLNLVEVQHGQFSLGLWLNKAYEASLEAQSGFTWKIDVDMVLEDPGVLEFNTRSAESDEFVLACEVPGIGNDKPWDQGVMGMTGTVGFPTEALGMVGGYEARLHNWGLDDVVLYREWIEMGMSPRVANAFSHVQHDDRTRTRNYEIKDLHVSIGHNRKELARLDPAGREEFWRLVGHRVIGR